ncbi:MAG: hypothetical protein ACE5K9_12045 [Candidatus Methylomirabilales bacterium]
MIRRIATRLKLKKFLAVLAILGFVSATAGCVMAAKEGIGALSGSDDSKKEEKNK